MKIYNAFGITPTNTHVSAGSDYYIPNITTDKQKKLAFEAFKKSYNKTDDELNEIIDIFSKYVTDENIYNAVHLYLALYSPYLNNLKDNVSGSIEYFMARNYRYDEKKKVVGVKLDLNDTLFINSGIKIALDTILSDNEVYPFQNNSIQQLRSLGIGIAGLYVNKSGKGNAGWDVRACLVDEDYSGYVHLSLAYTKNVIDNTENQSIVYCGDKLTQMMLIPVFHTKYEEINEEEYNDIMSKSNRGDSGFGSSDIKH